MATLKKIKVLSMARLMAVMMGLMGMLCGIAYSFGGFIYEAATGALNTGTALAFLALIGMPLLFAAAGFILGILEAYIFNMASKWLGGLEVDIEN